MVQRSKEPINDDLAAVGERCSGAERRGRSERDLDAAVPRGQAALEQRLACPHMLYRWRPRDADNPYFAILALADEIIVTADSISMIAEACATGKPTYLFDIEEGPRAMRAENGVGRPSA